MAITLNGSTGISSPGGDTSTSLSTGLLTVTGSTAPANGMYLPGTNILGFATNSSERVRIDASGNVAIGASAASSGLVVVKAYSVDTDGATSKWTARFQDSSSYGTGKGGSLLFTGIKSSVGGTGNYAGIAGLKENATDNNEQGYLAFYTTPSTGIITERARIDSSGNLVVGATSPVGSARFSVAADSTTTNPMAVSNTRATAATDYSILFYRAGNIVGSVQTSLTATTYVTSSDQRLKTNVEPAGSAIESILNFPVDQFDWISTGEHQDFGAVAQKAINFIPEMVQSSENPDEMWGIDWSKANPRLIRAIQELTARLEALEGAK